MGGARLGSGRKPLDPQLAVLVGHRPQHLSDDRAATAVADLPPPAWIDPPLGVPARVRAVWLELAPGAIAERTLTSHTAAAFELLCRTVILERQCARRRTDRGKGHQRGPMQGVEAGLVRFRRAPLGRPVAVPKPADPFAEFKPSPQ